jgi:hypothetical protein
MRIVALTVEYQADLFLVEGMVNDHARVATGCHHSVALHTLTEQEALEVFLAAHDVPVVWPEGYVGNLGAARTALLLAPLQRSTAVAAAARKVGDPAPRSGLTDTADDGFAAAALRISVVHWWAHNASRTHFRRGGGRCGRCGRAT